jgi:pyruvate dehydrogenase (quinone)
MNGINELITIKKYWRTWSNPHLVVGVLHNNDLNQVTWEMRAMQGAPQFLPSQELPDFPYATYAESLGLLGIRVDDTADVGKAWDAALRADRPAVIQFLTDASVPPIPPLASWEEMENTAKSLLRDDDRWDIVREGMKSKVQEFLPGTTD